MKKNILIFERDPGTLKFLKTFFKKNQDISAEIMENFSSLNTRISRGRPDSLLLIISSGEIKNVKTLKPVTIIATISGNVKAGIRNAVAYGAEDYILSPFYEEDLEHRIRSAFDWKIERSRREKLIITDYLTGIYNIRYFYQRFQEEFSRSERYNFSMSCLMLDIDYFKSINDKYGHKVGDFVLKEFAQLLKKHTRKSDILARYGGEEFIMALPHTNQNGALLKAESLRADVAKHKFHGLDNGSKLTVSIGVASYPEACIRKMEDLITIADNSLYTAKASGRNRVFANHSQIVQQNIGAGEQKKR